MIDIRTGPVVSSPGGRENILSLDLADSLSLGSRMDVGPWDKTARAFPGAGGRPSGYGGGWGAQLRPKADETVP